MYKKMKTFKKIAFVMAAACVAVSTTAKTNVNDRSLNEAGYQKAVAAPDRSAEGQAASYTAAKKAKVQPAQTVKNAKAGSTKSKKKCTAKKKATAKKKVAVKKTTAKKTVAKTPVKKAVAKTPVKPVEQAR